MRIARVTIRSHSRSALMRADDEPRTVTVRGHVVTGTRAARARVRSPIGVPQPMTFLTFTTL